MVEILQHSIQGPLYIVLSNLIFSVFFWQSTQGHVTECREYSKEQLPLTSRGLVRWSNQKRGRCNKNHPLFITIFKPICP